MNRVDQIIELVRAERRAVENGVTTSFNVPLTLQIDKLLAVEDLLHEYQNDARDK